MIDIINSASQHWISFFGYMVVQNTLFLGFVFLALYLVKNASARIKYFIVSIGLLKCLLPPFLPAYFLNSSGLSSNTGSATVSLGNMTVLQDMSGFTPQLTLPGFLFLFWAAIAVTLLAIPFLSTWKLKKALKKADSIPHEEAKFVQNDLCFKLHLSDHIKMPLSVGLFPDKIYVPNIWHMLPNDCRNAMLRHEIAHIQRKDGLVQFLQIVVQSAYFFHPLVWLLNARMNEYREMACDDKAVAGTNMSPMDYSRYLVKIAENMVQNNLGYSSVSALIRQKHKLLNRVKYQTREESMRNLSKLKLILILFGLLLLIVPFSWYCSKEQSNEQAGITTPPPAPATSDSAEVFIAYDVPPKPIDGFAALIKNLVYPESARKAGMQGKVMLKALIDVNGDVIETKIIKSLIDANYDAIETQTITSINNDCNEAAMEAVKAVKWQPAQQRGKPVNVWVSLPVVFQLDHSKKPSNLEPIKYLSKYDVPAKPIGGVAAIQQHLVYPDIARKAGVEGLVGVKIVIDEKGKVAKTEIVESLGNNGCDEAAVAAIKAVSWEPGLKDGKPIKSIIAVPVIFKLNTTKSK